MTLTVRWAKVESSKVKLIPEKKTVGCSKMNTDQLNSYLILQFTWKDHADVSPNDEVEDGVDEQQPAQPTERRCVSSYGRGVCIAPLNACGGQKNITFASH